MPRPYFTYATFALAMLGAIYLESSAGLVRSDSGVSFILCAPIVVLGYGIDWARLTRPGWLRGSATFGLGLASLALVFYGLAHDWLNVVLGTSAAALVLSAIAWSSAAWPRRVFEATYLGSRSGLLIFAEGEECWALRCDAPPELAIGERYAFRGRLEAAAFEGEGPFRRRNRIGGRVTELAPTRAALRERRLQRARSFVRAMGTSAAMVSGALILHNLNL